MANESAAKSDKGLVRTNNEDSFFIDPGSNLYIIADGMGGHNSGEVASTMACEVISKNVRQTLERLKDPEKTQVVFGGTNPLISETANQLVSSIRLANRIIFEASQKNPQNQGMGTTAVAVLLKDNKYIIAWVGDSRAYLIRHNAIEQLTTDHSLVQEQIAKGLISNDQAESSEFKNILTRALGAAEDVQVDAMELPVFEGDHLLLCTDGLSRMISDKDILDAVRAGGSPPQICDRLIERANAAGGRDNVTAIDIFYKAESKWKKFFKAVAGTN